MAPGSLSKIPECSVASLVTSIYSLATSFLAQSGGGISPRTTFRTVVPDAGETIPALLRPPINSSARNPIKPCSHSPQPAYKHSLNIRHAHALAKRPSTTLATAPCSSNLLNAPIADSSTRHASHKCSAQCRPCSARGRGHPATHVDFYFSRPPLSMLLNQGRDKGEWGRSGCAQDPAGGIDWQVLHAAPNPREGCRAGPVKHH